MGEKGDPTSGVPMTVSPPPGEGAYFRQNPGLFHDAPVGPTRQVLDDGYTTADAIIEDANGDRWTPGTTGRWEVQSRLKSRDLHKWLSLDPSHVTEWNDENPDSPFRYEDYGFKAP